ncbi:unnamed protein product [Protopolystoma xenopodis]|uniref:Uncharacterized protein n=1 Tax=Protopolystoma xenopodis TaxID=117903 RepID=A0A3S5B9U6_9PLAT|nr:unnamed protein product [Protopolystoma xenopodis]
MRKLFHLNGREVRTVQELLKTDGIFLGFSNPPPASGQGTQPSTTNPFEEGGKLNIGGETTSLGTAPIIASNGLRVADYAILEAGRLGAKLGVEVLTWNSDPVSGCSPGPMRGGGCAKVCNKSYKPVEVTSEDVKTGSVEFRSGHNPVAIGLDFFSPHAGRLDQVISGARVRASLLAARNLILNFFYLKFSEKWTYSEKILSSDSSLFQQLDASSDFGTIYEDVNYTLFEMAKMYSHFWQCMCKAACASLDDWLRLVSVGCIWAYVPPKAENTGGQIFYLDFFLLPSSERCREIASSQARRAHLPESRYFYRLPTLAQLLRDASVPPEAETQPVASLVTDWVHCWPIHNTKRATSRSVIMTDWKVRVWLEPRPDLVPSSRSRRFDYVTLDYSRIRCRLVVSDTVAPGQPSVRPGLCSADLFCSLITCRLGVCPVEGSASAVLHRFLLPTRKHKSGVSHSRHFGLF